MTRASEPMSMAILDDERIALLIQINLLEEGWHNATQMNELKLRVSDLNVMIADQRKAARAQQSRKPT